VVTNTHPNALAQASEFLEVVSVKGLIMEKLLEIRSF
jgi:hypothetical protein